MNEQTQKRIPRYLLERLACPVTKTDLIYQPEKNRLISKTAGLVFKINDGVPDLRIDHASPYNDEEETD